ncbi:glycine-rich protein [Gordonia phthalatica]|uniref:glycine-rich protein n=1 Tax=Gordonia phthalatica TaxID=1136941 RepID=UPI000781811B|nr:glycine-rich protein [Gordonia phthalatica]
MTLIGASAVAAPGAAHAALDEHCTESGTTVTCVWREAETAEFVVPEGVWRLTVTAIGGRGGVVPNGVGGLGAKVSGAVSVPADRTVFIHVAGSGESREDGSVARGGANGGGDSGAVEEGEKCTTVEALANPGMATSGEAGVQTRMHDPVVGSESALTPPATAAAVAAGTTEAVAVPNMGAVAAVPRCSMVGTSRTPRRCGIGRR